MKDKPSPKPVRIPSEMDDVLQSMLSSPPQHKVKPKLGDPAEKKKPAK